MSNVSFQFRSVALSAICLFSLAAPLSGCGQPVSGPAETPQNGAALIDLLRAALPDETELAAYVQQRKSTPQSTAALAPAPPIFKAIELRPYLILDDGTVVPLDHATDLTYIADGTLAIVPYEIWYSDATTDFHGFLDVRLRWSSTLVAFVNDAPFFVIREPNPTAGAVISGTAYNMILDSLSGVTHDNGQIPDLTVHAIDLMSGTVRSTRTDTSGTFQFSNLDTNTTWVIRVAEEGWLPFSTSVFVDAPGTWTGVDIDVLPAFTALTKTTSVYGTLRTSEGLPIPEATVFLIDVASGEAVAGIDGALTNSLGEYLIRDVPFDPDRNLVVRGHAYLHTLDSPAFSLTATDVAAYGKRVDLELTNSSPQVLCGADGQAGKSIAVTATAPVLMDLQMYAEDPDGDFIWYNWAQVSGDVVVTIDSLEFGASRVAIGMPGTYVFEGTAQDLPPLPGDTCTVTINVQ